MVNIVYGHNANLMLSYMFVQISVTEVTDYVLMS